MSGYNRCKECYNMKCIFATGEREDIDTDIDTSKCSDFRPMTNADSIRGMTDEELATFLFNNVSCSDCTMHGGGCSIDCEAWMLSWLKAPADKEGDG